jgi:hypothetical protein
VYFAQKTSFIPKIPQRVFLDKLLRQQERWTSFSVEKF